MTETGEWERRNYDWLFEEQNNHAYINCEWTQYNDINEINWFSFFLMKILWMLNAMCQYITTNWFGTGSVTGVDHIGVH